MELCSDKVGKKKSEKNEENAGSQKLLPFPQCFQKGSFFKVVKSQDCMLKGYGFAKWLLFSCSEED